jgi:hypothetical protein
MRKIAIVIAAVTGISAVAGAAYVYTTDICVTDSCRSEREEERLLKISKSWKSIGDDFKKKEILLIKIKEQYAPIIENHYNSRIGPMQSEVAEYIEVCEVLTPYAIWCQSDDWRDEVKRLRRAIAVDMQSKRGTIAQIDGLFMEAQRLKQIFYILSPELNKNESLTIIQLNKEFDEEFIKFMNEQKSLNVIDDKLIIKDIEMLSSIQSSIASQRRQIDIIASDGPSVDQ